MEFRRREIVLALLGAAAATKALADTPRCFADPEIADGKAALTIDVHAHIFNGSDLQIREFIHQVDQDKKSELHGLVTGLGGGLLQSIAWESAPTARDEARELRDRRKCMDAGTFDQRSNSAQAADYKNGRAALTNALASYKASSPKTPTLGTGGSKSLPFGVESAITQLPSTYEQFQKNQERQVGTLGSHPSIRGYISFVLHNFNRRYTNALDYLNTYSRNSARKIDLVVPSLVDYDYWLAQGASTKSPLADQIDVMKEIAISSEGRVHGFVAFCPFRELASTDTTGVGNSMRLVRLAIEQKGFVGVKLYPPMGFAAYGNTGLDVWRKKGLPPPALDPDFGARLDRAMGRLFEYCEANDVPIMAHTNASNTPHDDFKQLTGSEYWEMALKQFPGLRVSFGHFGDTDIEDHLDIRPKSFVALMQKGDDSPGRNAYADSSYFSGVLQDSQALRPVLSKLYSESKDHILAERLMYGTDWEMILSQARSEGYLAKFISLMAGIEKDQALTPRNRSLSDAFFGYNAVEFLGLRSGGNRKRLETFYANNSVPTPDWMTKVG